MKGSEIKEIRAKLGLNVFELASILGVVKSTIWKWESEDRTLLECSNKRILTGISERLKDEDAYPFEFGKHLKRRLRIRGGLAAMYDLLGWILEED